MSQHQKLAAEAKGYIDFFAASGMASFRHNVRSALRWPIRLLKVQMDAHEDLDPATDELIIGLAFGGTASARWSWDGGKWNRTNARLPGEIGVTPFRSTGLFQVDGASHMLVACLPVAELRQLYGSDVSLDFGALHDQYAHIPQATRQCIRMWQAASDPGPVSDDVIEAAALDLIEALQQHAAISSPLPEKPKRLSKENIRAIEAKIAELGPAHTTVSDLAGALDMPVRSFRRHFVETFAKRPHTHILEQRIKLGRTLVEDEGLSLASIALSLGFSSQAHFSTVFVRQLGITPAAYRRFLRE